MGRQARDRYDAVVVGAGPNGLVAAITLARDGKRVLLVEANEAVGGGARSAELTLPGFVHDLGSAIHPLGVGSPALRGLPLAEHGLDWIHPDAPLAHPLDDGTAVMLERSVAATAEGLGTDGAAYRRLMGPIVHDWPRLVPGILAPLRLRSARHPIAMARFGIFALLPACLLATAWFRGERARALFAGLAAHAILPLEAPATSAAGLVLGALGHAVGWPLPRGGAQAIADALTSLLVASGGQVIAGERARRIVVRDGRAVAVRTASGEYPARRAILATVQPQALFLDLVGEGQLPGDFVKLVRRFRWGTGVFVLHCALDRLPTFTAGALRGTLAFHLGRGIDTLAEGITAARNGVLPSRPLLIAGIHTLVDPSRAPEGKHTLWAMTHVPSRIRADQAGAVTAREWQQATAPFVERLLDEMECYAPGFRDSVLAAVGKSPADLEAENANLVGGDIGSGSYTLDQQVVFRPLPGWFRYKTPLSGLYMSGAATHPGGGVHGAAGANAARVLLADLRLRKLTDGLGGAGRTLVEKGRRLRRSVPASLDRWGDRRAREKW
jgi:phytoene dehydrogenase-like protein